MSSMVRAILQSLTLGGALALALPAAAQEAGEWDAARANLVAQGPGAMAREIATWQTLYEDRSGALPFATYAQFLVANPGFPDESALRARAEARLRREFVANEALLAYFDRFPPVGPG